MCMDILNHFLLSKFKLSVSIDSTFDESKLGELSLEGISLGFCGLIILSDAFA